MHPFRSLSQLCWLLLSITLSAQAATAITPVRALLFYSDANCSSCSELFAYYIPGLLERQGNQLEIAALDVDQPTGAALYQAAAGQYAMPLKWSGTPLVLIGHRTLKGLNEIGGTLGDKLVALARDPSNLQWPTVPGLAEALPAALQDLHARVAKDNRLPPPITIANTHSATSANVLAHDLAIIVLVGMLLGLAGSIWQVWRGHWCEGASNWPIWLGLIIGLGISGYTAYTSLADIAPVCGPIGDCVAVQHSEYAKLFGIPMGVLGLLGYAAILITWRLGQKLNGEWRWLPWGITLAATLFSIRLTALEVFIIGATCLWCLGSAITITSLLWLLSGKTRRPSLTSNRALNTQ
jgi:uncharacterized membrane protein